MRLYIGGVSVCRVGEMWKQGRIFPDIVCRVMYVDEVVIDYYAG